MVALRESPVGPGFRGLSPVGQYLGQPRFRWRAHRGAWLYRVEVVDADGREVARGWSGFRETPLAWLRSPDGLEVRLTPGERYRWRVFAYRDAPTADPDAAAPWAEFVFLGP
jgi:hypothetical protein